MAGVPVHTARQLSRAAREAGRVGRDLRTDRRRRQGQGPGRRARSCASSRPARSRTTRCSMRSARPARARSRRRRRFGIAWLDLAAGRFSVSKPTAANRCRRARAPASPPSSCCRGASRGSRAAGATRRAAALAFRLPTPAARADDAVRHAGSARLRLRGPDARDRRGGRAAAVRE